MKPPAEIGIYLLLQENTASASPMKHAIELGMKKTGFLNPGQTSDLGADQLPHDISKLLQRQYPNKLEEDEVCNYGGWTAY